MVHVVPPGTGPAVWWYAIEDWVTGEDAGGFEIFTFEGGFFATAITIDWDSDLLVKAYNNINDWLAEHDKLMYDDRPGHHVMFHANGPRHDLLGYNQAEYYFPIGIKGEHTK